MAFHDDLLDQAFHLAHKEPRKPKQASLRRAVSTAYYALFHLLIDQAVANWRAQELRQDLSRAFDHGVMKSASQRFLTLRFPGEDPSMVERLKVVAGTFGQMQELRHTADYNGAVYWTRTQALLQVQSVREAFECWKTIRKERIAQEYLLALLLKRRA